MIEAGRLDGTAPVEVTRESSQKLVRLWMICTFGSVVIFTATPQIDLAVSSLFYVDGDFPAARSSVLEATRMSIWYASVAFASLGLLGAVIGLFRGHLWGIAGRVWSFIFAVYFFGPALMANVLLQSYWGRARPAVVEEFGGNAEFTPALLPTDQCLKNCSFVSGEASGAVAFAIGIWLISSQINIAWVRQAVRACGVLVALVASFLRIAFGRHFLSDVVFAALLVTGIALLFLHISKKAARTTIKDDG